MKIKLDQDIKNKLIDEIIKFKEKNTKLDETVLENCLAIQNIIKTGKFKNRRFQNSFDLAEAINDYFTVHTTVKITWIFFWRINFDQKALFSRIKRVLQTNLMRALINEIKCLHDFISHIDSREGVTKIIRERDELSTTLKLAIERAYQAETTLLGKEQQIDNLLGENKMLQTELARANQRIENLSLELAVLKEETIPQLQADVALLKQQIFGAVSPKQDTHPGFEV